MKAVASLGVLILLLVLAPGCARSRSTTTSSRFAPPPEKTKTISADNAPFIAGKRNKVYHTRHCPYAASLESPIGFSSVHDAAVAGYIPCEFCTPNEVAQPEEKKEK